MSKYRNIPTSRIAQHTDTTASSSNDSTASSTDTTSVTDDDLFPFTSKDAIQEVIAIDEQLVTIQKAICPFVRGVPVDPGLGDETMDRLIDLKLKLQEDRQKAADVVHRVCELERRNPLRARKIERQRRENKQAVDAALELLRQKQTELRC